MLDYTLENICTENVFSTDPSAFQRSYFLACHPETATKVRDNIVSKVQLQPTAYSGVPGFDTVLYIYIVIRMTWPFTSGDIKRLPPRFTLPITNKPRYSLEIYLNLRFSRKTTVHSPATTHGLSRARSVCRKPSGTGGQKSCRRRRISILPFPVPSNEPAPTYGTTVRPNLCGWLCLQFVGRLYRIILIGLFVCFSRPSWRWQTRRRHPPWSHISRRARLNSGVAPCSYSSAITRSWKRTRRTATP